MKSLIIAILLSLLFTTGFTCSKSIPGDEQTYQDPVKIQVARDVSVTKLFEVDGCKFYKVLESGNRAYFTNCSGSAHWQVTTRSGKTYRTEDFSTSGDTSKKSIK